MGLDMYLEKRTYTKTFDPDKRAYVSLVQSLDGLPHVKMDRLRSITEEVMYWRKANAIHQWFVENVQNHEDNCSAYYVGVEQLEELVSLCDDVLHEPDKAHELLPTTSGFFFGGTEYDEYYYEEIKRTRDELRAELDEYANQDGVGYVSYYYQSSW